MKQKNEDAYKSIGEVAKDLNLVNTKTAGGSVYLGKEKGTVKTEGIYINAKALESDDGNGFFGQINPQKIENVSSSQGLF